MPVMPGGARRMIFSHKQAQDVVDKDVEDLGNGRRDGLAAGPVVDDDLEAAAVLGQMGVPALLEWREDVGQGDQAPRCRAGTGKGEQLLERGDAILADQPQTSCAEVKQVAVSHLADVKAKIADLRAMQTALSALITKCDAGDQSGCTLVESLLGHAN